VARGPAAPKTRLPSARFAIPKHVACRAFPTETVLLNIETGQYHGLNPTGGRMFEILGERGDFDEAAALLASEFEQPLATVTKDLHDLCASLIQRGLLETGPA
jgi:Coenzyme PQQ synthesis protein D (PqqD)